MVAGLAPGVRVEIRDAEWRIKQVDQTSTGLLLTCEGLSELVQGHEGAFLAELEDSIRILAPEDTELVDDVSSGYRASLLYLDTLIRQAPPAENRIYLGQHAALDVLKFQLEPALQALRQPRQRILIADTVGLGKTLEAGILVSELIARGRGKRILVLAVKSMLNQFQQEFWNRFSIGLTRLDSQGLQRVRNRIPSNHNPFHYFDRSIISIDTLKQDIEYRHYLEQAYWDIIIIDEAHNVADRGSRSQRARLAQLLATRSDTLIMLTATPHDGKAESFASLVNMLDPTAIANPSDYVKEDYRDKGLVIRRFKDEVREQLGGSFPERDIGILNAQASSAEENAYQVLLEADFQTLRGSGAGQLFRTTLTKALFSSPAALISTIENRKKRVARTLQKAEGAQKDSLLSDLDNLNAVQEAASAIKPKDFSKYQQLLSFLRGDIADGERFGWDPTQPNDRLVIFTESIPTLEFLAEHLPKDLKLKKNQVLLLRGDMRDSELAATVDNFNQKNHPARLLICSDVASEGINLHHLSHRMIHFDIPWSLMVFQQRNGRIDRYGQTRTPLIRYLLTDSTIEKIHGDQRVLEILIRKDEQAGKNIGDPSEFSQEEGEAQTAELIERAENVDLDALIDDFFTGRSMQDMQPADEVAVFTPSARELSLEQMLAERPKLFPDDIAYVRTALQWLQQDLELPLQAEVEGQMVRLNAPSDLKQRRRFLPREVWPAEDRFILTTDKARMNDELKRCRDEDSPWPEVHYLWPLHPVMEWLQDRALNAFGRHTAPVLYLPQQLSTNEYWFLLQGGFPNRRGQMHVHRWVAVHIVNGEVVNSCSLENFFRQISLENLVNPGKAQNHEPTRELLPLAIERGYRYLKGERAIYEQQNTEVLEHQYQALEELKQKHLQQVQDDLADLPKNLYDRRYQQRTADIERIFNDYYDWLENTQLIEEQPYLQLAAVLMG